MKKEDSEKKELALNQSNSTTRAITKITSATAYKIIKFGAHKIDLKFRFGQTQKTLSEYKNMDLLGADPDNWNDLRWSDFYCTFPLAEFTKAMGMSDGGKQREEIRKLLDDVTDEDMTFLRQAISPSFSTSYQNLTEGEISGFTLALARAYYKASRQGVNILEQIETTVFPLEVHDPYVMIGGVQGHLIDNEANSVEMRNFLYMDDRIEEKAEE